MLDLQGMTLKGFFQRNPEEVAKDLKQYQEDSLSHSIEVLERIERDRTPYDFNVKIIHYDSETGLFLAKGFDEVGCSGICGAVIDGHIIFSKTYSRGKFHTDKGANPLDQALRRFDYSGIIQNSNTPFDFQGTYTMPGHGKRMRGIWELAQDKKE